MKHSPLLSSLLTAFFCFALTTACSQSANPTDTTTDCHQNACLQKDTKTCPKQDSAIVINTIMTRRSVRQYKSTPVCRNQMDMILKCGINAPSGMNRQPWEIRVVDNQEYLNGITEAWLASLTPEQADKQRNSPGFRNMFRNAPSVIFIAAPEGKGDLDCGLLGENMILAAWSMGIGSCCLGSPVAFFGKPEAKTYLERLDLPAGYRLVYAIGMGYPDETPDAKERDASKARYID